MFLALRFNRNQKGFGINFCDNWGAFFGEWEITFGILWLMAESRFHPISAQ
jgi:hypothetical protein